MLLVGGEEAAMLLVGGEEAISSLVLGSDGLVRHVYVVSTDVPLLNHRLRGCAQDEVVVTLAADVAPDVKNGALVALLLGAKRVAAKFECPTPNSLATFGAFGVANVDGVTLDLTGTYATRHNPGSRYTVSIEAPVASAELWFRLFERLSWQGRQKFDVLHDRTLPSLQARIAAGPCACVHV